MSEDSPYPAEQEQDEELTSSDKGPEKSVHKQPKGCLWGFLAFVLLPFFIFVSCIAGGGHKSSPSGNEWAVLDTCHQAVEKALKDPESARYDDEVASISDKRAGGATWTATGTVRAKNSFGGYAMNSYTCTVNYTQNGEQYVANTKIK